MASVSSYLNTGGVATAAKAFIALCWQRPSRNIAQYQVWGEQIKQNALGSVPIGILVLAAIGVVLFLVVFFAMALFIIIRYGCNRCGGRYPQGKGYTSVSVKRTSLFIISFSIVTLYFSITGLLYTGYLSSSLQSSINQTNVIVTSAYSFVAGVSNLGDNAATLVNTQTVALRTRLVTTPFNISVITPATSSFTDSLSSLSGNITQAQTSVGYATSLIATLNASQSNTTTMVNTLQNEFSLLNWIMVNGTNMTISAAPNEQQQLQSSRYPSFSSTPNTTDYTQQVNQLPNITSIANDLHNIIYNFNANISAMIADQLNTVIPADPGSSVRGPFGAAKSTLDPITKSLQDYNTSLAPGYAQATKIENIRDDITKIEMFTIIGAAAIAVIAVALQKRKCLFIAMIILCIWSALVWIQFLIYFMGGVALDEFCHSKDALLSSTVALGSISLQPTSLLDGCNQGATLLNVSASTDGQLLISSLGIDPQLIMSLSSGSSLSQALGLTDSFRTQLISNTVSKSPNISLNNQFNTIDALNLTSFNFTAFNFNTTVFDVNQLRIDVESFNSSLTPQLVNSSYSLTQETSDLNAFNSKCLTVNPNWINYDYNFIVSHFVVTGAIFSPSSVTGSSSNSQNSAIQNLYDTVYVQIKYHYYADQAIATMRNNTIQPLLNDITSFGSLYATPLNERLTSLRSNLTILQSDVTSILALRAPILNAQNDTMNTLRSGIQNATQVALGLIDYSLASVSILLQTLLIDATRCNKLTQPLTDLLTITCDKTLPSIGGLWLCFFALGFSILILFICATRGSKRLGTLRRIVPIYPATMSTSSSKSMGDKGKGKGGRDKQQGRLHSTNNLSPSEVYSSSQPPAYPSSGNQTYSDGKKGDYSA